MKRSVFLSLCGGVAGTLLCGCAASPASGSKCVAALVLLPRTATADHSAPPPGNAVQYYVTEQVVSGSGCAIPAIAYQATLTTSDPQDISLSTPGTAVCTGATAGAATMTDTRSGSTAQLTCK